MADVMRELPLRSSEWTNYNPSDPGVTILENLTAFSALQGAEIVTLSYRAKMALLKMAGFVPGRGKCSRVLLSADGLEEPVVLPSGQRFRLGDICFETNREVTVAACRMSGVFIWANDRFNDVSFVLDSELKVPAKAFGNSPQAGNALYMTFDGNPENLKEVILYVKMAERAGRNVTVDRTEHIFADLDWEVYTDAGFVKVGVRDFTGGFVNSGEIRVNMTDVTPAICNETPESGYCIRAVLKRADYDIVPRITNLFGFLFEVWQKDTRSSSQSFSRADRVHVRSTIGENVYFVVFGKEEKGSSYRRYEPVHTDDLTGRYCRISQNSPGDVTFEFDEATFGYAPWKFKECVRVIIYSEEIMRRFSVGKVMGYDDQEIELPVSKIVHESFCLIARRRDAEGYLYDFVRPEKKNDGALCYHLLENEGRIIIEDAGDFLGADLFMGSVATTMGERGNIAAGNYLAIEDSEVPVRFYSPGTGKGGAHRETLEEVRARFLADMKTPYTAVTASDYEYLVKTTPGLCIRKTRAVMDEKENMIRVVVMPDMDDMFPKLPEIYIERIKERLSERRLITSRFDVKQPVYVAVGVRCTVYVKRHFTDCREQIEGRIRSRLDYIHGDHAFGEVLRFEDVFHSIEELPCVEYVYELSLHSENSKLAQVREYDVYPRYDCLCHPGSIQLQLVNS